MTEQRLLETSGEDFEGVDVVQAISGEPIEGEIHHAEKLKNVKDRVGKGAQGKRNIEIVDTIYYHQEARTMHHINKYKYVDERGRKHRLREKTFAEENLDKIEEKVGDEFSKHQNFMKLNYVTELENKAFVSDEAVVNQEKLKGHFNLKINHDLKMNKKIEMYANDNVAFFLHKGRNFIFKLK